MVVHSDRVKEYNKMVAELVKKIGVDSPEAHYARNILNRSFETLDELVAYNRSVGDKDKWVLIDPRQAAYHMNGSSGEFNVKFVSPDGHFEAVYDKKGKLVVDPVNMGTYNYFGPENPPEHFRHDVITYYNWGNTEADRRADSNLAENTIYYNSSASENLSRYKSNPEAVKYYEEVLKKANPNEYEAYLKLKRFNEERMRSIPSNYSRTIPAK